MRHYPRNSPQAAARIVALTLLADGHLSKAEVEVGQKVKRGDRLGLVGSTGRSTGPHLHYEVLINNVPQNPFRYILD